MTTASTTGKYINPTPTHSPTETVSDCSNCGEDMGSSLWASIQDGNPKHLHMCGKCVVSLDNPPTEPTIPKIDKILAWCKKELAVKVPENTKFEQGYRQAIESVIYLIETKEDIL